jgi:hypothetical protein
MGDRRERLAEERVADAEVGVRVVVARAARALVDEPTNDTAGNRPAAASARNAAYGREIDR